MAMNDLNNGCGPRCCQIFTWQRVMERERIPSIIFNQDRSTLAYIPLKNITRTTSRMPCIKLKTVPAIKHSAPLMRSSWSAKLIHYSSSLSILPFRAQRKKSHEDHSSPIMRIPPMNRSSSQNPIPYNSSTLLSKYMPRCSTFVLAFTSCHNQ